MPAKTIDSYRGEGFTETGRITKGGANYPTGAWTGFEVLFTARRSPNAAILVTKSSTDNSQIMVGASGSGTYTITFVPADTSGLLVAELLGYTVELIEPGGLARTVVAYGVWRITV